MIRRPPRSTQSRSSAASDVYKRQTLNGTVTANGTSTTVVFEYGLTSLYGIGIGAAQSPLPGSASGAAVSRTITGLSCNTLYHFNVIALQGPPDNPQFVQYGGDLT